jgi:hypothetical protein
MGSALFIPVQFVPTNKHLSLYGPNRLPQGIWYLPLRHRPRVFSRTRPHHRTQYPSSNGNISPFFHPQYLRYFADLERVTRHQGRLVCGYCCYGCPIRDHLPTNASSDTATIIAAVTKYFVISHSIIRLQNAKPIACRF